MSLPKGYIPQPLPFYRYTGRQTFRQEYCKGEPQYKQIVVGNQPDVNEWRIKIPYFQILREYLPSGTITVKVRNLSGGLAFNLPTSSITIDDLNSPVTKQAIVWKSSIVAPIGTPTMWEFDRWYYIEVSDGNDTWFSEAFYLVQIDSTGTEFPAKNCYDVVRLNWHNPGCIINELISSAPDTEFDIHGYGFSMFVEADPGKPKWLYDEEGDKDSNGDFVATFKRVQKEYELEFMCPEWVVDAVATMQLFSQTTLTFYDGEKWDITNIRIDAEWTTKGCFAKAKMKFNISAISKYGCC